ncbi:MAG: hypothetical protein EB163_00885 [Nitrososphaeria archaeon]|nr:hypothetical protein [Nitrososphaeria archaeon]NDB62332.1 hypothetical protein [Nitrosopumilaceae archaeon]NDB89512.1 hypothetical protein [Nitrososphaerota archaeon]NDF27153.1 hypothetical protein [Nitrosopumilaceae archaeon]NDF35630.1 hypothetical protein [Nitrosopumilaceae archaeon]
MAARGIAILVIPIIFSFVYGGTVLGFALQGHGATPGTQLTSIEILNLQSRYSVGDQVNVQVNANDPTYDCGNLYITVYNTALGQKTAVKQGAFFNQCYGNSGTLPIDDRFSEKFDAGQYTLEAQLFDKNGDKFLSSSQNFSVQ